MRAMVARAIAAMLKLKPCRKFKFVGQLQQAGWNKNCGDQKIETHIVNGVEQTFFDRRILLELHHGGAIDGNGNRHRQELPEQHGMRRVMRIEKWSR